MDADPTARDALERSLRSRLPLLSHDELRILDVQVDRILRLGRETYGPLDLAADDRDWGKEAAEELADFLFYDAARHVAEQDRRRDRLRCEAADELAITSPIEKGLAELRDSRPLVPAAPLGGVLLDWMMIDEGGEG